MNTEQTIEARDLIFEYASGYLRHSHVHETIDEFADRMASDLYTNPLAFPLATGIFTNMDLLKQAAKTAVRQMEKEGVRKI